MKIAKGAEFLRDCVEWLNARPERLNDGKNEKQLIREWLNSGVDSNYYKEQS